MIKSIVGSLPLWHIYKYLVTGCIGIVLDFCTTFLLRDIFAFDQYVANGIGIGVAILSNFLFNKYWTFHDSESEITRQFFLFVLTSIVGLLLNTGLIYGLINFLDFDFYISKLISIGIVFFWNFSVSKYLIFRRI